MIQDTLILALHDASQSDDAEQGASIVVCACVWRVHVYVFLNSKCCSRQRVHGVLTSALVVFDWQYGGTGVLIYVQSRRARTQSVQGAQRDVPSRLRSAKRHHCSSASVTFVPAFVRQKHIRWAQQN